MNQFVRRPAGRRFLASVFGGLLISISTAAAAVPAAPPIKAVLILDALSPISESAFSVVEAHTTDLPVMLLAERVEGISLDLKAMNAFLDQTGAAREADIVFYCDFGDPNRVVLYVSMPRLQTALIRNIDAAFESDASRLEITSVVIRGILTAMQSGGEIGIHVAKDVAKSGADVPSTSTAACKKSPTEGLDNPSFDAKKNADKVSADRFQFGIHAAVGPGWVLEDIPPVLHFQVQGRVSYKALGFLIAYRATMPFGKENDLAALTLTPHTALLGFSISLRRRKFVFKLAAATLFDAMSVQTVSKTPSAGGEADNTDFRVALQPSIVAEWFVTKEAFLSFSVSTDLYVYQNAFYIAADDDKIPFVRPWPVSPLFQIGIGFDLKR